MALRYDGLAVHITKLDTAIRQLIDLGLVSFEVHGADYEMGPVCTRAGIARRL